MSFRLHYVTAGFFICAAAMLSSCSTPITAKQWKTCEKLCTDRGGVMEACDEPFKGQGCHCNDDKIFWLDEMKKSSR